MLSGAEGRSPAPASPPLHRRVPAVRAAAPSTASRRHRWDRHCRGDARVPCESRCPRLLDVVGVGPDTAVALLITVGDNPERLDIEASFAAPARGQSCRAFLGPPAVLSPQPWWRSSGNAALIASCSPACGSTRALRTTTSAGSRRARPGAKSSVASNAMLLWRSSTWSNSYS